MEITIYVNEEELGPYSLEVVQSMLQDGEISEEDWAWYEGVEDYITVGEIPGIQDAPKAKSAKETKKSALEIYIWSDDADDWEGGFEVQKIQEMLDSGQIGKAAFVAYEGAIEGATIADIPGIEIKAKVPVDPNGAKLPKGGQKSGKTKREGGKGTSLKQNKAKLGKNKSSTTTKTKAAKPPASPMPRIITGVFLLLAAGLNVFIALTAPEKSVEFAQIINPFASDPTSHTLYHCYALYGAAGFCLLAAIFVSLPKVSILVSISGLILLLIGIWGIVAIFLGTTPLFLATGLGNLAIGLLSLIASKLCK
jgi:hypothetical protein